MILEIIYRIQQETIRTGLPEPFYKQMGAGFALVFEQEQGVADFSYEQDDKEDAGENIKTSGKSSRKSSQKSSQKIMEDMKNNSDITTQESLSIKSSQKIIDFMKHKPENTAPLMADLKSILNRNNITLNNAI